MSFIFPPTDLVAIDAAIQAGRGAEASVNGQHYSVYRLSPSTNVSVISGTPLYKRFPAIYDDKPPKKSIENQIFDLLAVKFVCNNLYLREGDVLVETEYGADASGQYVIAQIRPRKHTLALRVDVNGALQRPRPFGGSGAQQPVSGAVGVGYGGNSPFTREKLVLTNGSYDWVTYDDPTPPASVPIGLQPTDRVSPTREPDLPTTKARARYLAFLPLLPGVEVQQTDVIKGLHGDTYEVKSVYTSEQTGLYGWVCIVELNAN